MKGGLDQESLPNFLAVARGAAERSGLTLGRPRLRLSPPHEAFDVRGGAGRARDDARSRPSTSTTPAI